MSNRGFHHILTVMTPTSQVSPQYAVTSRETVRRTLPALNTTVIPQSHRAVDRRNEMKIRIVVLAAVVLLAAVIVAVTRLFWWENAGIVLALAGLVTAAGYLYHTFGDVDGIRTEQPKLDLVALLAGAAIVISSLLVAVFELTGSDVSKWLLLPFSIAMGALGVTVFLRETVNSRQDGQTEHSQSG